MGRWTEKSYDDEVASKIRLLFNEATNRTNDHLLSFEEFVLELDHQDKFVRRLFDCLVKELAIRRKRNAAINSHLSTAIPDVEFGTIRGQPVSVTSYGSPAGGNQSGILYSTDIHMEEGATAAAGGEEPLGQSPTRTTAIEDLLISSQRTVESRIAMLRLLGGARVGGRLNRRWRYYHPILRNVTTEQESQQQLLQNYGPPPGWINRARPPPPPASTAPALTTTTLANSIGTESNIAHQDSSPRIGNDSPASNLGSQYIARPGALIIAPIRRPSLLSNETDLINYDEGAPYLDVDDDDYQALFSDTPESIRRPRTAEVHNRSEQLYNASRYRRRPPPPLINYVFTRLEREAEEEQ